MNLTRSEIETNFDGFTGAWKSELPQAISTLDAGRKFFLASYTRIASLNAWRGTLLETTISDASLQFFAEAINDALVSHVLARFGVWRSALMSLRSCIENTCYCLYYKDHPIELRLWEAGKHRPGFTETLTYLKHHPDLMLLNNSPLTGLAAIEEEYKTLSRAVHASAKSFRMTPNAQKAILWKPEMPSLGKWQTREKTALGALSLLLITMFRESLQGAQRKSLREALSAVVPQSIRTRIKKELGVTIRGSLA